MPLEIPFNISNLPTKFLLYGLNRKDLCLASPLCYRLFMRAKATEMRYTSHFIPVQNVMTLDEDYVLVIVDCGMCLNDRLVAVEFVDAEDNVYIIARRITAYYDPYQPGDKVIYKIDIADRKEDAIDIILEGVEEASRNIQRENPKEVKNVPMFYKGNGPIIPIWLNHDHWLLFNDAEDGDFLITENEAALALMRLLHSRPLLAMALFERGMQNLSPVLDEHTVDNLIKKSGLEVEPMITLPGHVARYLKEALDSSSEPMYSRELQKSLVMDAFRALVDTSISDVNYSCVDAGGTYGITTISKAYKSPALFSCERFKDIGYYFWTSFGSPFDDRNQHVKRQPVRKMDGLFAWVMKGGMKKWCKLYDSEKVVYQDKGPTVEGLLSTLESALVRWYAVVSTASFHEAMSENVFKELRQLPAQVYVLPGLRFVIRHPLLRKSLFSHMTGQELDTDLDNLQLLESKSCNTYVIGLV